MNFDEFQGLIGVAFRDPRLLEQALTHRSYLNEHEEEGRRDNERLEFLGDAVLDFIAADMLFARFPEMPEGDLTRLRSALVRTEALAEFARDCRIGEVLLMGKGEESSGGRTRRSNLCRAFEAVVGALYLDQGLSVVQGFILPRLLAMLDRVMVEALEKDARSQFQEWCQAAYNVTPFYRKVDAVGPEHDRDFVVEVLIGEQVVGRGTGKSKRAAAQSAARDALGARDAGLLPAPVPPEPPAPAPVAES